MVARQHIEAHLFMEETNQAVFGKRYSDVARAAEQNESRGADGPTQGPRSVKFSSLGSIVRNQLRFPDPGDLIGADRQFLRRGPGGLGGEESGAALRRDHGQQKGPTLGLYSGEPHWHRAIVIETLFLCATISHFQALRVFG